MYLFYARASTLNTKHEPPLPWIFSLEDATTRRDLEFGVDPPWNIEIAGVCLLSWASAAPGAVA
jgi:hypothetical protein